MRFHPKQVLRKLGKECLGTVIGACTEQSAVALTFDDGPDPVFTPRLLEILERHQARATFFVVGTRAADHPDIVAQAAASGHAIGNHTWDHPSFLRIPRGERRAQLRRCAEVLPKGRGKPMFRPPFGHQNLATRIEAGLAGYRVVNWSIAEPDWLGHDAETIAAGIESRLQPGAIVLLHDYLMEALEPEFHDRGPTLGAVDLLLERLSDRYKFVTVPELLESGSARKVFWSQEPDPSFEDQLAKTAASIPSTSTQPR